jgi:hypothetical protein
MSYWAVKHEQSPTKVLVELMHERLTVILQPERFCDDDEQNEENEDCASRSPRSAKSTNIATTVSNMTHLIGLL